MTSLACRSSVPPCDQTPLLYHCDWRQPNLDPTQQQHQQHSNRHQRASSDEEAHPALGDGHEPLF